MNEPRDIPGIIAPPPLIALAALVLGLALDWLLPSFILQGVFGFWTRSIIGAILIAAGATMAIVAHRSFVEAGTNVNPWKPSLSLVTVGIFGWMRNPMYVGLMLILAGLATGLASDWTLVLLVPAALILHFGAVKREERYLKAKFGESYRAYMSKVPRYGWPR
jgi:protein-S-isoprenylcysteine O-methyltransferase Ste14